VQGDSISGKQLRNVGRSYRAIVTAAEAQARGGRVVEAKLVCVGTESDVVLRIAIREVDRDFLHARLVLDERQPPLDESLFDPKACAQWRVRAAGSGELEVDESFIRLHPGELLPVLEAVVQAESRIRARQLPARIGQVAGEVHMEDPLLG